ncbi:unnamed protein product, partial [Adineta steineri]
MMKFKTLTAWLYKKGSNYNLFMLEEHEYDDDDNDAVQDPAIVLKRQKYKTRLYVVLLAAIPYRNFASNNVTMHSVCSSIFIEPEWIKGLYFSNASQYGVWDFRTTAHSQFKLLSSFCSFSKEIISQTESDIDNNELVTLYLLSEEQTQMQIDGTIGLLKNSASSQMITYLDYLRHTIQTNYLVSALNTNLIITIIGSDESIRTAAAQVFYSDAPNTNPKQCDREKIVTDATLSQVIYELIEAGLVRKMNPMPNSTIVNGFFTGCTPLEAL